MKITKNILLLILVMINFEIFASLSIEFQTTEFKKGDAEFFKNLEPPPAPGVYQASISSQASERAQTTGKSRSEPTRTIINEQMHLNYYQSSQFPIAVNKYLLYHNVDSNYENDTVCILIQATNTDDQAHENIDIYELVPPETKIINCSVPIKVSSIDEALRYMRRGQRMLCVEDISNPLGLANKLISNDLPCNLSIKFLKNDTAILRNCSDENKFIINKIILKRFNEVIANHELDNRTIDERYLSLQTNKLMKLNNSTKLQENDRRLLNFLLLRDIYVSHIRKPEGYIEINEMFRVDEEAGIIHTSLPRIRPKESLMFIYFANISSHEPQRTNTIVGISGDKYPNLQFPFDITFPSPKFDVRVILPKQEVKPGDPIFINYIVDLLTPTNTSSEYKFIAKVENNNHNINFIDNKSRLEFRFSNGNASCNNSTYIRINESGSHGIPVLIIGDSQYLVQDKYIKVEELWTKYILVLTLMFLGFFTLIGGNLEYIADDKNMPLRLLYLFAAILAIAGAIRLIEISVDYIAVTIFFGLLIVLWWMRRRIL
jgi:hypothetical protein